MRLGILIACIIALILVCRFYSLPPDGQLSNADSDQVQTSNSELEDQTSAVPLVAPAVYDEPVPSQPVSTRQPVFVPPHRSQNTTFHDFRPQRQTSPPAGSIPSMQTVRALRPDLEAYDNHSNVYSLDMPVVAESEFDANAKNVQTLVRAQYEIPKAAAATLMELEPETLVETTTLESGDAETTIIQITTDSITQKRFSGLLSALFPNSSKGNLGERTAEMSDDGDGRLVPKRDVLTAPPASIRR